MIIKFELDTRDEMDLLQLQEVSNALNGFRVNAILDETTKREEVGAHPEEVSAHPEEVSARPEEVSAHPEEVSARPEEVSARPEEVSAHPEEAGEFTEDELKGYKTDELRVILLSKFKVDPTSYPGQNTNKKLRELVLAAQDGTLDEPEGEDDGNAPVEKQEKTPEPEPKEDGSEVEDEVEVEDDDTGSGITLEDLRKEMMVKFRENKKAIQEKFITYKVAKVSEVPEDKYEDFYTFLKKL